jgi:hypothetical protein
MAAMGAPEPTESRWGLSLPWWSLAISVPTTVFLTGLAAELLFLHSLVYAVAGIGAVDEPSVGRYELALATGIGTNVVGALGLSHAALRTRAAAWARPLTALLVASATGIAATAGMLGVVGISPLLLLTGL